MGYERDTYKYFFFDDYGRFLHGGITNNLYRRQSQHRRNLGEGYIQQVGRRVTRDSALDWESANGFQANAWEDAPQSSLLKAFVIGALSYIALSSLLRPSSPQGRFPS